MDYDKGVLWIMSQNVIITDAATAIVSLEAGWLSEPASVTAGACVLSPDVT